MHVFVVSNMHLLFLNIFNYQNIDIHICWPYIMVNIYNSANFPFMSGPLIVL